MRVLLVLVLLVAALPVDADYKDWRENKSGNYAWIDDPMPLSLISGPFTLEGRAGNDKPVPYRGSETTWVAYDAEDDGMPTVVYATNPTMDIGNVWIAWDDGDRFDVWMRLHDDPPMATPEGAAYVYSVQFRHTVTDVLYRVDAQHKDGAWNLTIHAETTSIGTFCEMPHGIEGGFNPEPGDGGTMVYRIDYRDLDLTTAPLDDVSDCQGAMSFGAPAKAGDVIEEWKGRASQSFGDETVLTWAHGDESDGIAPSWVPYTLGPISVPNGPFTATIRVNAVTETTVTTFSPCPGCRADAWTLTLDLDKRMTYECRYRVDVVYGDAMDTIYLRGANCLEHEGKNVFVNNLPPPAPTPEMPTPYDDPRPTVQGTGGSSGDVDMDGPGDLCIYQRGSPDDSDDDSLADHCDADIDGDGVPNFQDNCPFVINPLQLDTDRNGIGNDCDDDLDGDGYSDALDNCVFVPNPLQLDMDHDGIGNACDDDIDGDGVPNKQDAYPEDPREWRDLDGDGIPDGRDRDSDGDGVDDFDEVLAGTDPFNSGSKPGEATELHDQGTAASVGGMSLASLAYVALLLLVGVGLFFLVRPRS